MITIKKILIISFIIDVAIIIYFLFELFLPTKMTILENVIGKNINNITIQDNYKIKYVKSDEVEGTIIYQTTKNGIVEIYVSKYKEDVLMPFLVGKSYDEVTFLIDELVCNLGVTLDLVLVDSQLDNIIIDQFPMANKKIENEITLYIANLNTNMQMPNFIGKSLNDCIDFELQHHLHFQYVFIPSSNLKNTCLNQDLESGSLIWDYYPYVITIYIAQNE